MAGIATSILKFIKAKCRVASAWCGLRLPRSARRACSGMLTALRRLRTHSKSCSQLPQKWKSAKCIAAAEEIALSAFPLAGCCSHHASFHAKRRLLHGREEVLQACWHLRSSRSASVVKHSLAYLMLGRGPNCTAWPPASCRLRVPQG